MLVRRDLTLTDWTPLLYSIADLGAQALLYYINLEKELSRRRKVDLTIVLGKHIYIIDHRDQIDPDVIAQGVIRGK